MKRIFGTKTEKAPPPTMEEVTGRMNDRATAVDNKITDLDKKLAVVKQQLAAAKSPAQKAAIKQRAMHLLKQRKMYQKQQEQMMAQQMNLDQAAFMTEQIQDTVNQVAVMKSSAAAIKQQMKAHNLDDIEALQDQMQDLYYDQEEIQEIMGRSFAMDDEIDEDELLGELDMIEGDLALELETPGENAVPSYLEDDLPDAPSGQAAEVPQDMEAAQPLRV